MGELIGALDSIDGWRLAFVSFSVGLILRGSMNGKLWGFVALVVAAILSVKAFIG